MKELMRLLGFGGDNKPKPSETGLSRTANGIALPDLSLLEKKAADAKTTRFSFIIDSTGSRNENWCEATQIQHRMARSLNAGNTEVRLLHFGGGTLNDLGWGKKPNEIAQYMSDVKCMAGKTQIVPALKKVAMDEKRSTVILIGDAFEENQNDALEMAGKLRQQDKKIYAYYEITNDSNNISEAMFQQLAQKTGGVFAQFGKNMDLSLLCEATVMLETQGMAALREMALRGHSAAKFLLQQQNPG